jgi:hypothetical protein
MNCFFLVAKSDPHNGQIVYVSRNISSLLDYSQVWKKKEEEEFILF